jgi:signal peptidase I
LLRVTVIEPFSVPSTAMAMVPTLQPGDRILVVKARALTGPIHRGDIVVFHQPALSRCGGARSDSRDLVMRVIGLPGETIRSVGATIDIDGRPLREPGWYNPRSGQVGSAPIRRTTIPDGDYFVMGDNRTNSCDSRSFNAIPGTSIVGQVVAVVTRNGHPYLHIL